MNLSRKLLTAVRLPVAALLLGLPQQTVARNATLQNLFDFDHMLAYVMAVLLIGVFVLLFYNRLYLFREQDAHSVSRSQNARLALVLQTGRLRLWFYDLATRHYVVLSETGEYSNEYNPVEFSQFFDRDDFEVLRSAVFDICEGRRLASKVTLRGSAAHGREVSTYEVNVSIASRDGQGRIVRLLGIQYDATDDLRKKQKVNRLLMRYHTVFNSSLIDMVYYDRNGILQDINEKACQSFNISDRQKVLQGNYRLADNPLFSFIDIKNISSTYSTSITDFDHYRPRDGQLQDQNLHGKVYYESVVNPIYNKDGTLQGIYMAGRNVTELVESFRHQQEGMLQLKRVNKSIEAYIRNINYALRVSDVRLVNYYPDSYTLEISNNVGQTQLRFSQLRCIRLATPRFRRHVSSALNRMDHLTRFPIEQALELELRDQQRRPIWLMFHMVPMLDADGRVERYFGMCRNVTETVETENRLAVETKKAQETELLKQSFLTNMSYEIRTPLNTVVGFAELFEAEHDPADEPVFVEEIKRNSNSLLALVNDILFLSRLDANMIEYTKADVDFALIFEGHCQMGWSGVSPNVRTVVEGPYDHLVVDIDAANLGKVIEKLCTNAANFTKEGTIRARYMYRRGELIIGIEDSGMGIDEETLPHVFDRFVRDRQERLCGTGLDLPIVQELVQQMGGTVEFQSELGKGTTAWVSIPCEAKLIEKKRAARLKPTN